MARNKFNSSIQKLEFLTSIILKKLFDKNDCNPDSHINFLEVKIKVDNKHQRIILKKLFFLLSYQILDI